MIFPVDTILGQLEMITEYEYYDCPRLFSCKNKKDEKYIGLSVNDDDDGYQVWMYVIVSDDRLKEAETGEIDMHDVFVNAEHGFVYIVSIHDTNFDSVISIASSCIPEDHLPYKGQTLTPAEKENE